MSRRRCCCDVSSLFCSCPTNDSGYVGTACLCSLLNCNSPPSGLASCCSQVFNISATCDGMLYSPDSYSVFNAGDSTTVGMVPDVWAPGAPPSCSICSGSCTAGASANDFVNFQTNSPCRTYPTSPWMINRFMATPTNCTSAGPVPYAERHAPNTCFDANGCWVNAYLEYFVPTRYHGTYNASFKWQVIGANSRRPTVCNETNYNSVNITKLSASSDCGMTIGSFEIVCKTIGGQAYFIVQLVWTPLMDANVRGPNFGGGSCSGTTPPSAVNQTNLTWGTTFSTSPPFGAIGCSPVSTSAVIVRYRIPVGAPSSQPCGIRLGTYAPYEIANGTIFTTASLGAFPSLTIS